MPDWKEILRNHLRLDHPAADRETEILEELSQELEQIYREALAGGKSREEAIEIALHDLGDTRTLGWNIRRALTPTLADRISNGRSGPSQTAHPLPAGTGNFFRDLVRDMGHGFRLLLRRPGFSAVVVLTLAFGIGANTAVFSVINSVIFEPLPYGSPDGLVMLWETDRLTSQCPVSGPNFLDWREQSQSLVDVGAIVNRHVNLTGGDQPERVRGCLISAGTVRLLEVPPIQGRTLLREDEEPESERVVLISHNLWQRRFEGDPDVLGRTISLNGDPFTVVGIMPPGFQHPSPWTIGSWIDVWMAMPREYLEDNRGWHKLVVLGRLKDGVSRRTAQQEMNTIAARLQEQYPETNEGQGIWVAPLLLVMVGSTGIQLLLLFGASAVLLLIACGNVAGLLMARATVRQPEIAIRASLGASRGRLVRELVAENLPLFLLGGAVSLLLASWGLNSLRTMIPASIPRAGDVTIDVAVMIFAAGLTLLAGLVFGLIPALASVNRNLTGVLNQGTGSGQVRSGRSRSRAKMMVAQFALTLVLANGAALMLRSYMRLSSLEYGFSSENVVTMGLSLAGSRYDSAEKVRTFYDQTMDRVAALPGVLDVGATSKLPLAGGTNGRVLVEGRQISKSEGPLTDISVVTPGFFPAIGIPLLSGRNLMMQDSAESGMGAIVNQRMSQLCWPGEDPIGKRFSFAEPPEWITVVGVVPNVRQHGLERSARSEAYFPYLPAPPTVLASFTRVRFLVVRTQSDPLSFVPDIREAILAVDNDQPVSDIRTTGQLVSDAMAQRRFHTLLVWIFAAIALVMVTAGIYGMMSFFVARRTHEVGLRIALGANRVTILRHVLGRGLKISMIGLGFGLAGILLSVPVAMNMIYGVSPVDPASVLLGCTFLVAVGLLGSYLPARRAMKVDPVTALRYE